MKTLKTYEKWFNNLFKSDRDETLQNYGPDSGKAFVSEEWTTEEITKLNQEGFEAIDNDFYYKSKSNDLNDITVRKMSDVSLTLKLFFEAHFTFHNEGKILARKFENIDNALNFIKIIKEKYDK